MQHSLSVRARYKSFISSLLSIKWRPPPNCSVVTMPYGSTTYSSLFANAPGLMCQGEMYSMMIFQYLNNLPITRCSNICKRIFQWF